MAQAFAELSVAQIQAGLTAKEFSAKEVEENSLARIVSAGRYCPGWPVGGRARCL